MTELTWKTRDGRQIPLSEMTDSHLANAIKWADRKSDGLMDMSSRASAYAADAPDGAADCAEREAETMWQQSINIDSWAKAFRREQKRREQLRTMTASNFERVPEWE